MKVAYIREYTEWGCSHKLLNPTGRWKIASGAGYKDHLWIEHKGWFFKQWIHESDIIFSYKKESHVFKC